MAEAAAAASPSAEPRRGLYVHVPFCVRKCGYCDFYSLALPEGRREPDADRFLAALAVEAAALPPGFHPRTVFVGGGTPTELAAPDLERLLVLVRGLLDPARLVEWTVEANPGTLTADKARLLFEAGVTRVSLGVQSFDDGVLRFLDRIHTGQEAEAGFALLREAGFDNVNLDLIAAIPNAPPGRLESDLERVVALGPEHVSCYTLMFEQGTPLEALRRRGGVRPVPEEVEVAEYALARATLAAAGFRQYEISNHCRSDRGRDLRCLHNLLYWGPGEFYAMGPAAHGHIGRERYGNHRSLERWARALLDEAPPGEAPQAAVGRARAFTERLDDDAWAREVLVQWLRRLDGVAAGAFREATGHDLAALCGDGLTRMAAAGLLEEHAGEVWRLTERGVLLSDTVFAELI